MSFAPAAKGETIATESIYPVPLMHHGNSYEDIVPHHSLSTLPEVTSMDSLLQSNNPPNGSNMQMYYNSGEELEITDAEMNNGPRRNSVQSATMGMRRPVSPNYIIHADPTRRKSRDGGRSGHHGRPEWLIDRDSRIANAPGGYDYWTLPRSQELFRRELGRSGDFAYETPGKMLYSRRPHEHRASRKTRKHKHSRSEKTTPSDVQTPESSSTRRNELKVYFRFSNGVLADGSKLDYRENENFLAAFQAHCRGWLTRKKHEELIDKNDAVCIIQRNAERMFNPWIRLMLALRPLLKTHRTEEELFYLRSELERYKTLVKMLRFENAEYQAKVANLLQLIEQMNIKGSENEVVENLVQQISETMAKNQDFWQDMAVSSQTLHATTQNRSKAYMETDGSPTFDESPMTQLRQDADFYRNQVDMLKEEADEQQHRSSEHFQGQVSVLSERVEHLQHLLALESSKVQRLSSELEEMNSTIANSNTYERNLEHTISQLSKQLEQRSKARETVATPITPSPVQGLLSLPPGDTGQINGQVQAMEQQLNTYKGLVEQLRGYFTSNPKVMTALTDSPFQPGGEMDLFSEPMVTATYQPLISAEPGVGNKFFTPLDTPFQKDQNAIGDLTPRAQIQQEMNELRRQLTEAERNLRHTGEDMKRELEDRETLENENLNLHNRVAQLDRKLRRAQDENDEALAHKDVLNQRKLKELTDQLEEELRKTSRLSQQNRDMERELVELRIVAEPDEDILNDEWESMKSKLRSDVAHYKRQLDLIQDEYEQYRHDHDPMLFHRQVEEKDERISGLEREKQQWRMELDVQQVKLQNATSLLEDTEHRLKLATRERTTQLHRISLLEGERDDAIREAANLSGRASAEKENITGRLRELDQIRIERDGLRRELTEVKQSLAGCSAENTADKRQLQARLRELELHNEARVSDLKTELERTREHIERLQMELQSSQTSELELKTSTQQRRWKFDELEDQLSHAMRRINTLERRNTDMDQELVRAKADLHASREAAIIRKASRAQLDQEWLQAGEDEDTDDERNASLMDTSSRLDYGGDGQSDVSSNSPQLRKMRAHQNLRSSSMFRSNPSLFRTAFPEGRSSSVAERPSNATNSGQLDRPVVLGKPPAAMESKNGSANRTSKVVITHDSETIRPIDNDSDTIDD